MYRQKLYTSFLLLFVLGAAASVAHAQGDPGMPISRTVSGQVRFAQGGGPAENVIVRLESFIGGFVGDERTDRLGKFRFSGLGASQYVVTVRQPGYRDIRQQIDLQTSPTEYLQLQLVSDGTARPTSTLAPVGLINANVPAAARDEFEKGRAALVGDKDVPKGLAHLEKAVSLYPEFYEAHLLLGTAYMDAGKWDKSEAALRRAGEVNPKSGAALFALGEVFRHQKKYDEAEKALTQGLALEEKSAVGHFTLGRVYWERGDFVKAGPQVGRALQINPQYAEAHLLAGNILLRARRAEDALVEFEEYLRLAPKGEFAEPTRQLVQKLKKSMNGKKP